MVYVCADSKGGLETVKSQRTKISSDMDIEEITDELRAVYELFRRKPLIYRWVAIDMLY